MFPAIIETCGYGLTTALTVAVPVHPPEEVTLTAYTPPTAVEPANTVGLCAEDAQGRFWVASYAGELARLEGERFVPYPLKGLSGKDVWDLVAVPKAGLWYNTLENLDHFLLEKL